MRTHYNCMYCNAILNRAQNKYNAFCDYFCKRAYQHEEKAQPRLRAMRKTKAERHDCPTCGIPTWAERCYACSVGLPQVRVSVSHETKTPQASNRGVSQGRLL